MLVYHIYYFPSLTSNAFLLDFLACQWSQETFIACYSCGIENIKYDGIPCFSKTPFQFGFNFSGNERVGKFSWTYIFVQLWIVCILLFIFLCLWKNENKFFVLEIVMLKIINSHTFGCLSPPPCFSFSFLLFRIFSGTNWEIQERFTI